MNQTGNQQGKHVRSIRNQKNSNADVDIANLTKETFLREFDAEIDTDDHCDNGLGNAQKRLIEHVRNDIG